MGADFTIDQTYERELPPKLLERLADFERRLPGVDGMTKDDFDTYIRTMPKTKMHVTPLLERLLNLTEDPYKVRAALREGWFLAEMVPDQNPFLRAFRLAGFIGWDEEPKPESPIIAFRGTINGFVNRISWTTNVDIARSFAMRNQLHHRNSHGVALSADVYRVEVQPKDVLGLHRLEEEVLVDYEIVTSHLYERLDLATDYDPLKLVQQFKLDRPPIWSDPNYPH